MKIAEPTGDRKRSKRNNYSQIPFLLPFILLQFNCDPFSAVKSHLLMTPLLDKAPPTLPLILSLPEARRHANEMQADTNTLKPTIVNLHLFGTKNTV